MKELQKFKNTDYYLILSGSHLEKKYGKTINEVLRDKHRNIFKVKSSNNFAQPARMAISVSKTIFELTKIIQNIKPNLLVVHGDRFEALGAAIAAHENNIGLAHLEGGDITMGGTHDDNIRHSITKLAHLHFPTNNISYKRILALGEEKWRTKMFGFTGLDPIKNKEFSSKEKIIKKYNLCLTQPIMLFTFHPLSSNLKKTDIEIKNTVSAIKSIVKRYNVKCLITFPNNDSGNDLIINKVNELKNYSKNVNVFKSVGRRDYWGLLNLAREQFKIVCVGNSSSGIKETTPFACPTVNIGDRQKGRAYAKNILQTKANKIEIEKNIEKSLFNKKFLKICQNCKNPYGQGNAGKKIANVLSKINLNEKLLVKKFNL